MFTIVLGENHYTEETVDGDKGLVMQMLDVVYRLDIHPSPYKYLQVYRDGVLLQQGHDYV